MESDLIFDIGLHNGSDTDFYLKKGFRVVAVEASPKLVSKASERFESEIASGQLTLLNVGIHERSGEAEFFINPRKDDWSSFVRGIAARDSGDVEVVTVPIIPAPHLFEKYGIPYFLKCDIEGHDRYVMDALLGLPNRPTYVSVEAHSLDYMAKLHVAGYKRFKLVNQALNGAQTAQKPPKEGSYVEYRHHGHSSGYFGEESPGQWLSFEEAAYDLLLFKMGFKSRQWLLHGWLDIHAKYTT